MKLPLLGTEKMLLLLVAVNTWLIGELLFLSFNAQWERLGITVLFTLIALDLLRCLGCQRLLNRLLICVAGGLGILIGCALDFGRLGLLNLASLCASTTDLSGFDGVALMLSLAPWTHAGMWISCSVVLLIVDHCNARTGSNFRSGVKHLLCIGGMLLGMWAVHLLPTSWFFNDVFPLDIAIGFVWRMWLGMSAGMLFAFLLLDAGMSRLERKSSARKLFPDRNRRHPCQRPGQASLVIHRGGHH